jgi:hypothetical protein
MKDTWFNAMFNEDFDDYYKNIMNGIVDHINYRGCEGNDALVRMVILELAMMKTTATTTTTTTMTTTTMTVMRMINLL